MEIFVFACSGGEDSKVITQPNLAPSQSSLIYPSENLLCIDNNIAFNWAESIDPEGDVVKYKLSIAKNRTLADIVEQRTVSGTGITITLEKGVAYYWRIIPIDNKGNEGDATATLAFYTEGNGISNYAPFTAALVAPNNDSFVDAGTVSLIWKGGDTNVDDILTYELFFGDIQNPPMVSNNLSTETSDVVVEPGKTYYWKVNTLDNAGAKTIGQEWMFNVN
tara:strand:- start:1978 stop:2640 length:663 start_codon:yes stop_codon:yes gene_type:complete